MPTHHRPGIAIYPTWRVCRANTHRPPAQDAAAAPTDPDAGADTADTAQTLSAGECGQPCPNTSPALHCALPIGHDAMHRHGAIAWAEQTAVPGEPLPPIPAECYPAGADDLEVAVDKPDEPEAAHRWWHRIPWRTR